MVYWNSTTAAVLILVALAWSGGNADVNVAAEFELIQHPAEGEMLQPSPRRCVTC
jgi:hypothetical protein